MLQRCACSLRKYTPAAVSALGACLESISRRVGDISCRAFVLHGVRVGVYHPQNSRQATFRSGLRALRMRPRNHRDTRRIGNGVMMSEGDGGARAHAPGLKTALAGVCVVHSWRVYTINGGDGSAKISPHACPVASGGRRRARRGCGLTRARPQQRDPVSRFRESPSARAAAADGQQPARASSSAATSRPAVSGRARIGGHGGIG
jgi:hypothetical protein